MRTAIEIGNIKLAIEQITSLAFASRRSAILLSFPMTDQLFDNTRAANIENLEYN